MLTCLVNTSTLTVSIYLPSQCTSVLYGLFYIYRFRHLGCMEKHYWYILLYSIKPVEMYRGRKLSRKVLLSSGHGSENKHLCNLITISIASNTCKFLKFEKVLVIFLTSRLCLIYILILPLQPKGQVHGDIVEGDMVTSSI